MSSGRGDRTRRRLLTVLVPAAVLLTALGGATPAFAGVPHPAPRWRLESRPAPTMLPLPGTKATIAAVASNLGDAEVKASTPITITDELPPGLKATAITSEIAGTGVDGGTRIATCSTTTVSCTTAEPVRPYGRFEVHITVENVEAAAGTVTNEVKVQGGDLPEGGEMAASSLGRAITVSGAATPFGIESYEFTAENEDGSPDTRAGSHPFQLTTTLNLNQTTEEAQPAVPALLRNVQLSLPPGLLGDPGAVAQCSDTDFSTIGGNTVNACSPDTAIGVATVVLAHALTLSEDFTLTVPVFNLAPAPGEPARFGFEAERVPVIFDTSVRTGGDYGVVVSVHNASELAQVLGTQVTLWGEPGAQIHDQVRGWACLRNAVVFGEGCAPPSPRPTAPFLTLATSCAGASTTLMQDESWAGDFVKEPSSLPGLQGCEALPFSPSIAVQPIVEAEGQTASPTSSANTPTGMRVDVELPQKETTLAEGGLAEADVQDTSVTLPAGVQLSPSAANGLEACSEGQVGYEGGRSTVGDPFAPFSEEPLHFSTEPAHCPPASKVGIVHIDTPLLAHELEGGVYLAAQEANPFGSLFALYIVAEDPVSGVRVKLAGKVTLNPETGQLTTTFQSTPQVPFERLTLELFGGPHASLSTPPLCGSYATTSSFTAWAGATQQPSSPPFSITSGPNGAPCSNPQPFAPSFQAGPTSLQAGAFAPFTLTIGHPDADQPLGALTVHLPPGVAAILASVTPCPEPQAAQGTCGPESLIGHSSASSGLGSEPYTLPGQVFLTGPYKGAPFGIEVVTPAIAGPFNLGEVTVRSTINIDPNTAAVTISSDPFPTFVKGVPAQIKQINVTVDRPGFEFNPTNCDPMAITATLTGAQGASEGVSAPFKVENCASLPFKPKLTATAGGKASKSNGAAFAVKVESRGLGQANIAKVDLQLPVALPARLSTIQKACVAAVFEANPAACDEGSLIGHATIRTPVLKNPLTGPAYLVSHGGAAFPDVEFVLQGEGITLVLDGKTDIKRGITYSRFESAPDAPFTTFETVLPAGPHSALTSNVPEKKKYSLCGTTLMAPTEITAQDGALIKQSTKIAVTGCAKPLTRPQLLARALKACRKLKHKGKRAACEKQAREKYGPEKAKKSKKK